MHPFTILSFLPTCPARQYKEAARVAAEIKVVNSSLDSEREGIKEAESRLATMNKQLSSIGQELAETKEELGGMEREEGEWTHTHAHIHTLYTHTHTHTRTYIHTYSMPSIQVI